MGSANVAVTNEKLSTWKGCCLKFYSLGQKMHVEERNMYSILTDLPR